MGLQTKSWQSKQTCHDYKKMVERCKNRVHTKKQSFDKFLNEDANLIDDNDITLQVAWFFKDDELD